MGCLLRADSAPQIPKLKGSLGKPLMASSVLSRGPFGKAQPSPTYVTLGLGQGRVREQPSPRADRRTRRRIGGLAKLPGPVLSPEKQSVLARVKGVGGAASPQLTFPLNKGAFLRARRGGCACPAAAAPAESAGVFFLPDFSPFLSLSPDL